MLTKTNRDMRVVSEEIFGPVVCVQSFDDDDLDQVAKFANDTEYGLQASIWTHNLQGRPFARAQDQGRHDLRQHATTTAIRPGRSAATSSPAGAARWARK